MRTLALGDIHGCFDALQAVTAAARLTDDDRLITLGDYIDRGPNSRAVLDWVIARLKRVERGRMIPLRGNHELMMAQSHDEATCDMWLSCGGKAALASYGSPLQPGTLADIPETHWRLIKFQCRHYFQTRTHFFVHANAYPDVPLEEQPQFMLYWESFNDPPPHQSGKIMICGHTPQHSGIPRHIGHAVCIDTWVYGDGWLTCLDVDSGQYWQANERGETRTDFLEPVADDSRETD
jgi:serine/threonine protein phosphatase 1